MLVPQLLDRRTMRNRWTKNHPFKRILLGAANTAAGVARGGTSGATKRAAAAAQSNGAADRFDLWTSPTDACAEAAVLNTVYA
jgi:hypothetical protein